MPAKPGCCPRNPHSAVGWGWVSFNIITLWSGPHPVSCPLLSAQHIFDQSNSKSKHYPALQMTNSRLQKPEVPLPTPVAQDLRPEVSAWKHRRASWCRNSLFFTKKAAQQEDASWGSKTGKRVGPSSLLRFRPWEDRRGRWRSWERGPVGPQAEPSGRPSSQNRGETGTLTLPSVGSAGLSGFCPMGFPPAGPFFHFILHILLSGFLLWRISLIPHPMVVRFLILS
jgi:hypothetical protein